MSAIVLGLSLSVILPSSRALALECDNEVLLYDGWGEEKLYAEAELFSDTQHISWGTRVCIVESKESLPITWVYVRTPENKQGWLDNNDLVTTVEFRLRAIARRKSQIQELKWLLQQMNVLEKWLKDDGIYKLHPSGGFRELVQQWMEVVETKGTAEEIPVVATPTVKPTSTPKPKPTLKPTRTPTPIPDAVYKKPQSMSVAANLKRIISPSEREYVVGNYEGFVNNFSGEKCWYKQVVTRDSSVSYFFETLQGADTLMIFDDPKCMHDELNGWGMRHSQIAVNTVISRWYSKPDARFLVEPEDMFRRSDLQIRGWCIQSSKYPTQGITIDYFADSENNLAVVIHQYSLQECKN